MFGTAVPAIKGSPICSGTALLIERTCDLRWPRKAETSHRFVRHRCCSERARKHSVRCQVHSDARTLLAVKDCLANAMDMGALCSRCVPACIIFIAFMALTRQTQSPQAVLTP
jgi:hypothetical protein